MPRVSRKQTEQNRETITDTAARLFREHGLHGISVADVMAAAGLTHGGFYGHFESREALAAEACSRAFEQSAERWQEKIHAQPSSGDARKAILEHYLSPTNRDSPGQACPVTAFAGDMGREQSDSVLRSSYVDGLKKSLETLGALNEADDEPGRRQQTLVQYSLMVGALTLARATRDDALSDELLEAARHFLQNTPDL